MNNDFDKLLNFDDDLNVNEKELSRKINKQANMRIFKIVIFTLIAIVVMVFGVSEVCNLIYYDAGKESQYTEPYDDGGNVTEFQFLMDIFTGLNNPGTAYIPMGIDGVEKHGFGSYTVKGSLQDAFHSLHIGADNNMKFEIKRGKLTYEDMYNLGLNCKTTMFYNPESLYYIDKESSHYAKSVITITDKDVEAVEELPDSSYFKVLLSFNKLESMDDTLKFIRKYPDSYFTWIGIDSDHSMVVSSYDGIRLDTIFGYELTKEVEEKYPELLFQYSDDSTGEELEQCYLSRIKLIKDNPDFLKMVSEGYSNYRLDDDYETVKTSEDVKAVGVCGTIKKADFLKMVKSGEIKYAHIQDVKLSKFN